MNSPQLVDGIVRVDLGGGQAAMTQQLLDGIEVGPVVKQMSGKTMPQHVRAFLLNGGGLAQDLVDQGPGITGVEFFTGLRKQQPVLIAIKLPLFLLSVRTDQLDHFFGQRKNALLFSLA